MTTLIVSMAGHSNRENMAQILNMLLVRLMYNIILYKRTALHLVNLYSSKKKKVVKEINFKNFNYH